ncbi:uncharacterized protein ASPGLDRAFT_78014 [Aspergillus glaucus CBS 516.65]|uniref:Major facilitator superfamily (MFS) profile domain-containing protein n=1 Tax=Aspergillus glaucus CBS 516.65 TaxID=1160497 RepID=A0A1L9V4H1_ASPGL|nr:hypothetical protein ASPGLDRAFT_78014 [Aspergillus glaucus CBS 516.65]OJJ78810.1 hypothetical protein ASPGLDRAFT_78014 [Aspergillus glaucus CBS 516.65]
MAIMLGYIAARPFLFIGLVTTVALSVYVIYWRYIHQLAKYPGPFLASLTDLWQSYQFLTLRQPYHLTELHERYGPIVRYGPDKLSITEEAAIQAIYQKGARFMPKTEFYDAYGAVHPNVFGMRDESMHSTRRRHMSHSFSISYVKEMEKYLDMNISILKEKIRKHCQHGEVFDLKKALHYYVIDVLGELAFSQSFEVQETGDESRVPPVVEHSLLAAATGAWPAMTKTLKKWLPLVPHKGLRKLIEGRQTCADLASASVKRRLSGLRGHGGIENGPERKDILTNLIKAKDPETGESLTQADLETEAFGFIIAGTHTTSATTSLLLYHLLHHPEYLAELVNEIDSNLPPLERDTLAYSAVNAEALLPFLRKCVRENFRITPVFTMPLARRVVSPEGVLIAGHHIPQGTSIAVCNHAFHHNPRVWGEDHDIFNPYRWDQPDTGYKARYLMHFGLGGRQCIGKTVATANIYKLTSTLLAEFKFELADGQEQANSEKGKYHGKIPELVSVGISDLKDPLTSHSISNMKPELEQLEKNAASNTIPNRPRGLEKSSDEFIEDIGSSLSPEHRQYLLNRHGTLDIYPIPDFNDADPYNWPSWKKITNLSLVAFHAMMATFTAAAIQCAFVNIAEDLHVSVHRVSYLVSLFIAIIGGAPLLWCPLANCYGRRPVLLISLVCSLVGNVGCAVSHSYATMGLCRAITAFFISPAAAIGSAVVAESFFLRDRARCMGVWTLMVTLGVPTAPFIFGFAAMRIGYRWIYWVLVMVNAVQLVVYLLLGPETLYIRTDHAAIGNHARKRKYLPITIQRIRPTPLDPWEFIQPLILAAHPCVILPACAYAMVFLFGSILPSIEIPQIWPEKFGSNTQQVGLQFISQIVGSVIGEQVGGHLSDRWMWYRQRRRQQPPAPECRLWISYIGLALTICGTVVFLVQTENASSHWNITPLVGVAIAAAGNQVVTTVYVTYAIDCYSSEAASVGVLITFVRQIWGFIGPFW